MSPVGDAYKKKGVVEASLWVEMARLATESSSWICVDDWESQQAEWVETARVIRHHHAELSSVENCDDEVDTVKITKKRRRADNERSLSGCNRSDILDSFNVPNLWKEEDIMEIVGRFGIVCIPRHGYDAEKIVFQSVVLHKHRNDIHIVTNWVTKDISATHVRRAVRRGQSVCYLLPENVVCYIQDHQLYSTESEQRNADVILSPLERYGSATE